MNYCTRLRLQRKASVLKSFLVKKGLERSLEEETNLQLGTGETLHAGEDIYNREFLKYCEGCEGVDVTKLILKASENYLKEFRRYVAYKKLLSRGSS
jgi:hypothetical protein